MTDNNHPITPPPELVAQIRREALHGSEGQLDYELRLIHDAYCAGADMELGACGECVDDLFPFYLENGPASYRLRAARRPKPLNLKEQALETLRSMQIEPVILDGINVNKEVMDKYDIIRRALEALPD